MKNLVNDLNQCLDKVQAELATNGQQLTPQDAAKQAANQRASKSSMSKQSHR